MLSEICIHISDIFVSIAYSALVSHHKFFAVLGLIFLQTFVVVTFLFVMRSGSPLCRCFAILSKSGVRGFTKISFTL